MNRIVDVFGSAPVLLPVVHPISREAALEAVRVAHALGIRGVFLIDQGMSERDVFVLVHEVHARHPALWIGVNLLSRRPAEALGIVLAACGTIDGLWADDAGIDERGTDHPRAQPRAQQLVDTQRAANWNGLYFGGVAFKYQREITPADLPRAAAIATAYVDVLCTSGPGTGFPADIAKVRALREGLGPHHAMALASGITPENVRDYMPYVQAFLVGTGIEERLGVFDPAKIERLLRAMS